MVEERFRPTAVAAASSGGSFSGQFRESTPVAFGAIEAQDDARISSGIEELDRVLGGGIVAGSLVLIGGAPGIGKSTIVLQMAEQLVVGGARVLYISGEESERQIKMRGERLGVNADQLFIFQRPTFNRSCRNRKASPGSVLSLRSRKFSASGSLCAGSVHS